MPSPVYFANIDRISYRGLILLMDDLFTQAGFDRLIRPGDSVAVKIHTGDEYSPHTNRPGFIRRIVDNVRRVGGLPVVSDACQLYKLAKFTSHGLIESARTNGFDASTLGAPVVPADGYHITFDHPMRCEDVLLEVPDGAVLQACEIASLFVHADVMLVGARVSPQPDRRCVLKHVGMGCASKRGKASIHRNSTQPLINLDLCTGCGVCVEHCSWDAISLQDGKARIDYKLCVGCGFCAAACGMGTGKGMSERKYVHKDGALRRQYAVVDAAAALIRQKQGKVGYFAFLMDYVDECENWTTRPVFPDIGVLASLDPVALDAAAYDLISKAPFLPGSAADGLPRDADKINCWRPGSGFNWEAQLAHAEKLGLGTRQYELIEVDASGSKYDYHEMPGYATKL